MRREKWGYLLFIPIAVAIGIIEILAILSIGWVFHRLWLLRNKKKDLKSRVAGKRSGRSSVYVWTCFPRD